MRTRLHIAFILVAFSALSCQKTEFESCTNYDQLVGEWESINSDTKNSIEFNSNGKNAHYYGLERRLKYNATSCKLIQDENSEFYYYYFIYSDIGPLNYKMNTTFDTITAGFSAQDISEDTTMLYKMKFVKVK